MHPGYPIVAVEVNTPIKGKRKPERPILRGRRENALHLENRFREKQESECYHIVGVEMSLHRQVREQVMSLHQDFPVVCPLSYLFSKYSQGMGQI